MKTFLVSYDLGGPETSADYKKLQEYIKSYSWAKPLYSQFFIKTDKSVSVIRDEAKKFVDSNDKLMVLDVTGVSWATSWSNEVATWMKDNI